MRTKSTNFEGAWEDVCEFCGQIQLDHQIDLGTLENVRHIARQPCEQEQYEIKKRAVARANTLRGVVFVWDIGRYVWDKIPLKTEFRLVYRWAREFYVGLRGWYRLRRSRPR